MELEQMVQLVTDRLMEKLHASNQPSFAIIGKAHKTLEDDYLEKGYQQVAANGLMTADILIVAELSLFSLSRLSQLLPQTKDEEAILNHMMQKKVVYVLEEGLALNQQRDCLHKPILAEFDKAMATLQKWGVKLIKANENLQKPLKGGQIANVKAKKELVTVTKLQAQALSKGDHFYIKPNMIVTALAKDYLKDKGIIVEMGEG